jgi:putative addiction module CopG family antidote
MGYALAREQQRYIARLVKSGRYNNQSEVVREAIRRLEREETEHLTPPPLTPAQVEEIYGTDDPQADRVGRGAFDALRKAVRKRARPRTHGRYTMPTWVGGRTRW